MVQFVGQTLANAIITISFYALLAVGLSLAFGVMRTANFAHGEFYMVGAYTVWLLYGEGHLPFFAAVVVAIVLAGILGWLAERTLFRPMRGNILGGFLISIGLIFILQVFVARMWGVGLAKPVPTAFPGVLEIGGISVGWQRFVILVAASVLLGGLYFFLARTRLGRSLRACSEDSEAASVQGISANTSAVLALVTGCAMAGAAGALMAPIMAVTPYMGGMVIWICFVVIVVGGAGNLKGTILAAIFFGLLNTIVTTLVDSTFAAIVSSLFMLVFLSIRPQGMLGYAEK